MTKKEIVQYIRENLKNENVEIYLDVDDYKLIADLLEQEPILDKINKMKSEIADALEFWDYSPNNNPLARDMLETLTNFWGDIREVEE